MARRRPYADPTADKAERNLERWLREKRAVLVNKKKAVYGVQPATANRSNPR